ncbi:MAG: class I mannose-6-phosphate isomerase [Phycisphaeraceae bacterium]|nr:class I mannose-6-phosphate isomerase [Phycisphaerae bacterium]MBX3392191.1 class I mannose-6-phosphate isomerase [Phycisphaeraceae bacterium]
MTNRPYPIILNPILMSKVWGGRGLSRLGKKLPHDGPFGESWELADLASTSSSGGGGGAARSVIANGPLAGRTIHDALTMWGRGLLGEARPTPDGAIPLLIKFLDAKENLSVQVHPSPAYAAAHPGSDLKTECWIILDAAPGSCIYKGVRSGVTPESFRRSIDHGTVAEHLVRVPAVVGECHNLPSGTCHALGAGVLVAEVQTPSDTTFRVFDWGRTGRELHVEQALECIDFSEAPPATCLKPGQGRATLVQTEFFRVDRVRTESPIDAGRGMSAWIVIEGEGRVTGGDHPVAFDPVRVARGDTFVIPSGCAVSSRLEPDRSFDVVRVEPA